MDVPRSDCIELHHRNLREWHLRVRALAVTDKQLISASRKVIEETLQLLAQLDSARQR